MKPSFRLVASAALVLTASLLGACGGTVSQGGPDGSGGGSSTGGTGSGGGSCEYAGRTYANNTTFPDEDGCNDCTCEDGFVGCTEIACVTGCFTPDGYYEVGESFPAGDGCNTCTCAGGDSVNCTLAACLTCESVASSYWAYVDAAKACDPTQPNQCTQLFSEGLACSSQAFANPANSEALTQAEAFRSQYGSMGCGAAIDCAPSRPAIGSYCSAAGQCEALFDDPGFGAACRVEGVTYSTGSTGVPDPFSCNTCDCINGELVNCTEADCDEPCPPNGVPGTQCAVCGPTDACAAVEHTCLPVCAEGCVSGQCMNGVCKNVCG